MEESGRCAQLYVSVGKEVRIHESGKRAKTIVEYRSLSTPSPLPFMIGTSRSTDLLERGLDLATEVRIVLHLFLDLANGVDHSRVVATAEMLPDSGQGHSKHLFHEIHRDLSRDRDVLRAALGRESVGPYSPPAGHELPNSLGREHWTPVRATSAEHTAQRRARESQRDLLVRE